MNNLLNRYIQMFNEYPPKLMMTSYEDDVYQELLRDAINDSIPITKQDVEDAYEGYQIDVYQDYK